MKAQYRGDHIPGFVGLQSGTEPPPGLYVGNILWIYPTADSDDHERRRCGYAQFKITGDRGSDIPTVLRGFKDRVFALGPEFNIFIPGPRLTLLARYEPEFAGRNRTQGQTIVFSIVWVAKSLVKAPQP